MIKRALGAASALVLVASQSGLAACGSSQSGENAGTSAAALASAHVAVGILDASGKQIGEGAGVLIAPNLVLTSAHLVAGNVKWTVKTADGKTAYGTRGKTYDWMSYESDKSHPRKHDVAVIYLDKAIERDAYPKITTTKQLAGTAVKRTRHDGTTFDAIDATLATVRTFPHAFVTDMPASEKVDTGGAVVNDKNEIVAIVTGRGLTTGKLYMARVEDLGGWMSPKILCASGSSISTTTSTQTYGTPPPPKAGCDGGDGGGSGTGSSGGDSDSDGGGSGTGDAPPCDDGGGNCNGDCPTNSGTPSDSTSSSSSSSSSTGGSNSGTPSDSDNPSTSSSSGSNSGTPSGSDTPSSSGGADSDGDIEVCDGPTDNPTECPPEPTGCTGPSCGGGTPDDLTDYGNCACGGGGSSGSTPGPR